MGMRPANRRISLSVLIPPPELGSIRSSKMMSIDTSSRRLKASGIDSTLISSNRNGLARPRMSSMRVASRGSSSTSKMRTGALGSIMSPWKAKI